MERPVGLVYHSDLGRYNFTPSHPLQPRRLELTLERIRQLGLLDDPTRALLAPPRAATRAELRRVHTHDYLAAVASGREAYDFGIGYGDNPLFPDMHEISALVAGGSALAMEKVLAGEWRHAFAIGGGLHHALPNSAAGFCIYNDPAVAIHAALDQGLDRVLYIDIDAHHGDGVQEIFYRDPRVLTISVHETGRTLFPGTGFVIEIGEGEGRGYSANVPLEPWSGDEAFLAALTLVVEPLARHFRPQVIVTQNGCDPHILDPLTHLQVTLRGYAEAVRRLHRLAHELCDGRLVALGGGGYAVERVVPLAWSALFADLVDAPGPELPAEEPEPRAQYEAARALEAVTAAAAWLREHLWPLQSPGRDAAADGVEPRTAARNDPPTADPPIRTPPA